MSKTLYELALEYDESIKQTQQIVVTVRKQIKDAEAEHDSYKVYSLSKKLEMLYEEIRDMKIVSEKLKNYYKDEKSEEDAA